MRFSGDGRSLYVWGSGRLPALLYRIDLSKGTREPWKQLAPPGASSPGSVNSMAIAPDVGAYAYTFSSPETTLHEVSGLR